MLYYQQWKEEVLLLGNLDAAREDLCFVLKNGNKLAAVDKARELLETL